MPAFPTQKKKKKGPNLLDIGHLCSFIPDKELPAEMGIRGYVRKGFNSKTLGT